ncbi:hypothetical protein D1006_40700 [Burkholderia stabilis]|uniref:Uncharacterized protein n=1 Tax=Burkholderia stabilis TaxID=95485 RepID=A0A4Q2A513_9BURK|nr:hypothetical protein [Burkholderia stabilis]RXV64128.1 hypothetical protein D1006_40700 [Burkholderia stabilis]
MFSTPDYFLIQEIVPEQWASRRISSVAVGVSAGRSTYPTPAHALALVLARDMHADFEIHVRADDMTAPVQVRCALLKLRDAGFGRARQAYELTAEEFSWIGLTVDDVEALRRTEPYLGTAAAPVLELVGNDKVALELAVVVQGG